MNLKKNLRKRCMIMGLTFGLGYAAFMVLTRLYGETLAKNLLYFAGIAIITGPLYGLLTYWILHGQQKKFIKRFPTLAQKTILLEQNGLRVTDAYPQGVSGGCFLTDDALYYSPEIKKFADLSIELPLQQIQTIQVDIVNNQEYLLLHLISEDVISLRLGNKTTRWAHQINEAMQKAQII